MSLSLWLDNETSPFSQAALASSACTCCKPAAAVELNRGHAHGNDGAAAGAQPGVGAVPVLQVHGDPEEVARATDEDLPEVLRRVFGREGLFALFGRAGAKRARHVKQGGMNHAFMVACDGRLVKCVRPRTREASESSQVVRLRREVPSLLEDAHALFPMAAFSCREPEASSRDQLPCEVLVFEYLEGCRSLGELLRLYELTHAHGPLQQRSCCPGHQASGSCEHYRQLHDLMARQVPALNLRYQLLHGRRHGDFKVENVFIERGGQVRLGDFLTAFCSSCDRSEFLGSTVTMHPLVQETRAAAARAWIPATAAAAAAGGGSGLEAARALSSDEKLANARLVAALESLDASRRKQSMFGPFPSLMSQVATSPTFVNSFDGGELLRRSLRSAGSFCTREESSSEYGAREGEPDASPLSSMVAAFGDMLHCFTESPGKKSPVHDSVHEDSDGTPLRQGKSRGLARSGSWNAVQQVAQLPWETSAEKVARPPLWQRSGTFAEGVGAAGRASAGPIPGLDEPRLLASRPEIQAMLARSVSMKVPPSPVSASFAVTPSASFAPQLPTCTSLAQADFYFAPGGSARVPPGPPAMARAGLRVPGVYARQAAAGAPPPRLVSVHSLA